MKKQTLPNSQNNKYTGVHSHSAQQYDIEFVSYERFDKRWDVFIFTDEILNNKIEKNRIDSEHIFCETINSLNEFDEVCNKAIIDLGEDYKVLPFYKENLSRKICDKIHSQLKSYKSQGMRLYQENNYWVIAIRKIDFEIANQIIKSNIE